jgi:proline iminopeptidase
MARMESPSDSGETVTPCTDAWGRLPVAQQGYVPVDRAQLFYREIGQGQLVIVMHGGPSFDHTYLLPDLDRLADAARLIYYDQRGRGKSGGNVQPEDVSLASEVADAEALRQHFHLDTVAVLGHSWGGLLALEYATRFPEHVSHLILMNTAPASYQDWLLFDEELRARRGPGEQETMQALASSASFEEGDADTRADYYRLHFRPAFARPDQLDRLVARLRTNFAGMTRTDMLRARQIGARLFDETAESSDYDLLPQLTRLRIPTLVIHGDHDFIPVACAAHIAQAVPDARLIVLDDCGHFASMESPEAVRTEIIAFLARAGRC